jgi:hypothetical protein
MCTVTVQKENSDKQRLMTNKLAIIEEDLLDRYRRQQGLQTVAPDADDKDATTTSTTTAHGDQNKEKMDQASPSTNATQDDDCKPWNQTGSLTMQRDGNYDAMPTRAAAAVPTRGRRGRPRGSKN